MQPTSLARVTAVRAGWLCGPAFSLLTVLVIAGCAINSPAPSGPRAPLHVQMNDRDRQLADAAVQRALESSASGSRVDWHNEHSGNRGSVSPLRTYRSRSGHFCREYEENLRVGRQAARYRDTACRAQAGDWRLLPVAVN